MNVNYTEVVRPEFPPYKPQAIRGSKLLFYTLSLFGYLLLVLLHIFVYLAFVRVFSPGISTLAKLLNTGLLIVEYLSGLYSVLLVFHYAHHFLPSDAPEGYNNKYWTMDGDITNEEFPKIQILLPIYREATSVVTRSLLSAIDLNYPTGRYEVVVIDDTPDNVEIEEFCKKHKIIYMTREDRSGFKAGAMNYALSKMNGDLVFFMDADHILEKNVLLNAINAWRKDTIAVQMRIDFVNLTTYLTKVSAFLQLQYFSLFQRARRATGSAIFSGTAVLFDLPLLKKEGGLQTLTIAEDTDTTAILRSKGYRVEYLDKVGTWGLIPWDPLSQIRQVWRWLTGVTRSFRARFFTIIRGKAPLYTKFDYAYSGFFPTVAVMGWFLGFVLFAMIMNNIPIISDPMNVQLLSFSFSITAIGLGLLGAAPLVISVLALIKDGDEIVYMHQPLWIKVWTYLSYYILIIAAQPLLVGAIIKGWLGTKVEFNRTPKEKLSIKNTGLRKHKIRYIILSIIAFSSGLLFLSGIIRAGIQDPRSMTLFITVWASILPLILVIVWFWKLEAYLEEVEEISSEAFLVANKKY